MNSIEEDEELFNYKGLYNNCSKQLEDVKDDHTTLSDIIVYFQQDYVSCAFPRYYINKCIRLLS